MPDVDAVMRENRDAIEEMAAAAERCTTWTTPRAPGKWSPSQVVEHVAMALEESGKAVSGQPTKFPVVPAFVRPLLRRFFLKRVVRKGTFASGARTNRAMDPATGPATPSAGRARLMAAMDAYEQACRAKSVTSGTFESTIFGAVSIEEYGRFQAMHTRHHRRQLPS